MLLGEVKPPGDRVMVYGRNCWEWIVGFYAIAKTGVVLRPITPCSLRRRSATSSRMPRPRRVERQGLPVLDLVDTDGLTYVVLCGDPVPSGATSFAMWLDEASSDAPHADPHASSRRIGCAAMNGSAWSRYGQRVPSSTSLSRRRMILPEAVMGTSSTICKARGIL